MPQAEDQSLLPWSLHETVRQEQWWANPTGTVQSAPVNSVEWFVLELLFEYDERDQC